MKRFKLLTVAVVVLASAGTSLAGPSIVANGSFETGPDIPGLFLNIGSGSTAITGWTVMPTDIDYISPTLWHASDGERSVDLDGTSVGGIKQDLATVVGTTYLVEFDMAGNGYRGPDIKTMDVVAGSQSQSFSFDTSGMTHEDLGDVPWDMGWQTKQWSFVAESAITTLQFKSTTDGAYGPALDNISVSAAPVPAPGAVLLGSLGAGLVGWMRRRRAL